MDRLKSLMMMALTVILFTGVAHAQVVRLHQQAKDSSAPGWDEFRDLSERLETLEAENQLLRNEAIPPNDATITVVSQAGYCDSCGDAVCSCGEDANCSWVDQISSACKDRLSWNKGPIRVVPFGYVAADMIFSQKAYTLLGGPLFLLPAVPSETPDSRFTITGQQTTLGALITGPDLGDLKSSATVAFNFFGDRPIQNNPGAFLIFGYAELENDDWRIWAGQDADAVGRQNTNSPAWTSHKMSGNMGQVRPGFRLERYDSFSEFARTSIYFGLTQQVVLDFIALPQVAGSDNGWPNVETRWELSLGPESEGNRPVMLAIGGVIGETRAVDFMRNAESNVSTSWAVIPELHLELGDFGFQGEAFVGNAIGTYNAGIGQSLNPLTDEPIYTVGGFGEFFYHTTPSLTVSVGYGVDDPRNTHLGQNQRSRNETYWTNAIWKISEHWESRFEVARQKTNYIAPSSDSSAMEYLMSFRFYF
ncbi:hypothetical protein CA54_61510 [Symmachiella macrocystis]|uniref:Porin subfamily protein n=1 Tax=Symmachiella macrocystis TaxID=2527985 RepID=A0A5C6AUB5_9PLAN|nr:hypothetical protein [Symmachiella macrocystis]TWU03067.1 hypothetical protein CA54_61510 [Symmachiella macrocystis]